MIAAQPLDLLGRRAACRASGRAARRRSAGAASRASATSTVRLPSTRSSPAGLPVVAGSPKTPSRSSRSWNASPSGSPNAVSSASARRRRAGERGAEVERPLDGVLRRLVAQHRHRGVHVGVAAGLGGDVEELAGDHLGAAQVEHVERRGHDLAAAARSGAAARRTTTAAGRRGGSRRRRRTAPGRRATRRRGARARRCGACWPAAAAVRGVHVVVVHQRAGVQQLERGAGPDQRVARRRAARRRGAPTSRTTRGTSCRRPPTSAPRRPAARRRGPAAPAARPARRGTRRAPPGRGSGSRPGPTRRSRGRP